MSIIGKCHFWLENLWNPNEAVDQVLSFRTSEVQKLSSWKLSRFIKNVKNFQNLRNPWLWPGCKNFRDFLLEIRNSKTFGVFAGRVLHNFSEELRFWQRYSCKMLSMVDFFEPSRLPLSSCLRALEWAWMCFTKVRLGWKVYVGRLCCDTPKMVWKVMYPCSSIVKCVVKV